MGGINLRPYQVTAMDRYIDFTENGGRRGVVVLPTGCGKTIFGLSLAKKIGGRVLWLAHREELIFQPKKAIESVWPEAETGIVKAERNQHRAQVVFASVQTARIPRRLEQLKNFDFVVVDECHHAAAKSYKDILAHVGCIAPEDGLEHPTNGPLLLGLTATPERSDNKALDDIFEDVVYDFQIKEAIESGYLSDISAVQSRIELDFSKIPINKSTGDFNETELAEIMSADAVVRSICASIYEHARDHRTIIFAVCVEQAQKISELLLTMGIAADVVHGGTSSYKRRNVLQQFYDGDITHLSNCLVATEGYDNPRINCVVVARPTKSKSLYKQMVGRGLRKYPGKDECLILDIVGATEYHNLVQAPALFGWKNTSDPSVNDDEEEPSNEESEFSMIAAMIRNQIRGLESKKTKFSWVKINDGHFTMSCGNGGQVHLWSKGGDDLFDVDVTVMSRDDKGHKRIKLTHAPVDIELAQGLAEDYARRTASKIALNTAPWRLLPATSKQISALRNMGYKDDDFSNLTKGEASDMITAKAARIEARRLYR